MSLLTYVALGVASSLLAIWVALVAFLFLARPDGVTLKEVLSLLPDTVRLLRRLATDATVPVGARFLLWLLLAYLLAPIDIVPDFIPVVGHADDAIIVCAVLRWIVRRAGSQALRRNWPGSEQGLAALSWAAGLPPGEG